MQSRAQKVLNDFFKVADGQRVDPGNILDTPTEKTKKGPLESQEPHNDYCGAQGRKGPCGKSGPHSDHEYKDNSTGRSYQWTR